MTENEEAEVTVIELSEGVSQGDCTTTSSTSGGTDSCFKSCRSVVWRYFDKDSVRLWEYN